MNPLHISPASYYLNNYITVFLLGAEAILGIFWYNNQVSKVSDRSRGKPEGSLFNSYYTEL